MGLATVSSSASSSALACLPLRPPRARAPACELPPELPVESLLRPPRGLRRPTRSAWLCSQLRGAAASTSNVGSKGEYAADTSAAPPLPALLLVSLPPSWLSKSSDSACSHGR
jgi:hypothetical protein